MQAAVVLVPIAGQFAQHGLFGDLAGLFLRGFEFGLDGGGLGLSIACADVVGVDFPERRMVFDFFVKQRLRDGGVVDLAMPVAAVADQVDDHIGAEAVTVFGSHPGDADNSVYVFTVNVENGNRLAARDARRKAGRVLLHITGGESQQVVDDYVNRAADGIAGQVSIVHGFGQDALSGESSVAVHQQRKIFFASTFARAVLLGASAAHGDGVDSFEVAGI